MAPKWPTGSGKCLLLVFWVLPSTFVFLSRHSLYEKRSLPRRNEKIGEEKLASLPVDHLNADRLECQPLVLKVLKKIVIKNGAFVVKKNF